jgi:hypothetical protein
MSGYSGLTAGAGAEAYDFYTIGTLLDVGGGHGSFLSLLLARYPKMTGASFDRPEVIAQAAASIPGNAAHKDRLQLVAGDFMESVPTGPTRSCASTSCTTGTTHTRARSSVTAERACPEAAASW